MATTYNFTNGSITGQPAMIERTPTENDPFLLRHIVDFSKQDLEAGESDVGQCLRIPAKTEVLDAWPRVITAETADGTFNLGYGGDADYWGKNLNADVAGSVKKVLTAAISHTFSEIADGDEEAVEVTVAGACVGDKVIVAVVEDLVDLQITGSVTAEDTVTLVLSNSTGGALTLGAATGTVYVDKSNLSGNPVYFSTADTIDIVPTTTNGDVDLDGAKIEVVAMCRKALDTY